MIICDLILILSELRTLVYEGYPFICMDENDFRNLIIMPAIFST